MDSLSKSIEKLADQLAEFKMEVIAKYLSQIKNVEVPEAGTVRDLMVGIDSQFQIAPERQKLTFKGKNITLSDEPLSTFKIGNKARVLVSVQSEVQSTPSPTPPTRMRVQIQPEFLTSSPHADIIAKGPPVDAEKPYQGQMGILPKTPFSVYNTDGILSRLNFESDAIWVESSDDKQERIFFSDIKGFLVQEIPKHEKTYVALCMATTYGKRWYYFIPCQYTQLLNKLLGP